jgi:hypothetical protein
MKTEWNGCHEVCRRTRTFHVGALVLYLKYFVEKYQVLAACDEASAFVTIYKLKKREREERKLGEGSEGHYV